MLLYTNNVMLSEAVGAVETSPGKVPYECLSCNYVIARRRLKNNQVKEVVFLIVHARVPIPRKRSSCLVLLAEKIVS